MPPPLGFGLVTGGWTLPVPLQRIEGVAILLGSIWLFTQTGQSWWLFALLLLMPDLGMVGYLAGPRLGAVSYNLTHTLVAPLGLLALAALVDHSMPIALAAIWGAHIGMDRALGYGLKHASGFKDTHLGRIAP